MKGKPGKKRRKKGKRKNSGERTGERGKREREKTARTMWEKRKLIRSGSTLWRGPRP